jgi:hypothetical protein
MAKTRKNRSKKNFLNKITKTGKKAIPVVKTGLKKVGNTAKVLAVKTAPIVENGISKIYGTMVNGFNFGVNSITSKMSRKGRSKRRYR